MHLAISTVWMEREDTELALLGIIYGQGHKMRFFSFMVTVASADSRETSHFLFENLGIVYVPWN